MDCDCARSDREPQTVTARCTIACRIDTVEGLENELQILLGHAGTAISNDHFDALPRDALRIDTHARSRRRIPYGVANNILHRATQQLRITVDAQGPLRLQRDAASVCIRLDSNVR